MSRCVSRSTRNPLKMPTLVDDFAVRESHGTLLDAEQKLGGVSRPRKQEDGTCVIVSGRFLISFMHSSMTAGFHFDEEDQLWLGRPKWWAADI
jgi:hypothetical protein